MPYCRKCGTELKENARFCHVCGTYVTQTAPPKQPQRRSYIRSFLPASLLIAIVITAIVVASIVFLPIHTVDKTKSANAPYQTGTNKLKLNFTADIAQVNITFEDLPDSFVVLNVSVSGTVGVFAPPDAVTVTFNYTFEDDVLKVNSRVSRANEWMWAPGLRVACNLRIDPSLNLTVAARTTVGEIAMHTNAGITFDSLNLQTTTGSVRAELAEGTLLNGDMTLRTTTGGIDLTWENVIVTKDIRLNVGTTTGGLNLDVKQSQTLPADVTLNAQATTGGIILTLAIGDDFAAYVESSTTIGGITSDLNGFNGTKSPIQSSNYPSTSNLIADLKTTTGGIYINATYIP